MCRLGRRLRACGIAWYARTLGGLLAAGACDERVPLAEVLNRGIERVSQMHAGTCDLGHPATPGATVIIARQRGDTLEYLVLCDSVLVLMPRAGEPCAITDTKLGETMARFRRPPAWRPAPGTRCRVAGLLPGTGGCAQPARRVLASGRGPRRRGPCTDRFAAAGRPVGGGVAQRRRQPPGRPVPPGHLGRGLRHSLP